MPRVTPMGSRNLRRWLNRPLTDQQELRRRYQAVALLVDARRFEALREPLRAIGDVERILVARGAAQRAAARSHVAARVARGAARRCAPRCKRIEAPLLVELRHAVGEHADVVELLQRAIAEEPSVMLRDGDVIAAGYDAELDELRRISTHTDEFLLDARTPRARALGHPLAEARLQPRLGLLHRSERARRRTTCPRTTSAGRP